MDGANMNAQVGLTSPAAIGADVCHHQPAQDVQHPARRRRTRHGADRRGGASRAVSARTSRSSRPAARARFTRCRRRRGGSASILLISYAYMKMLGRDGMTDATRYAILNANYIKSRLEPHYPVLYTRRNGRVAHEMIFDLRPLEAGERCRRRRRCEAADGLRLPRADRVVPGPRHADGRADRERIERRARSVLRRDDRDPRRRFRRSSTARRTPRTTS